MLESTRMRGACPEEAPAPGGGRKPGDDEGSARRVDLRELSFTQHNGSASAALPPSSEALLSLSSSSSSCLRFVPCAAAFSGGAAGARAAAAPPPSSRCCCGFSAAAVELMGCLAQNPRRVQRIGRLRVAGCNGNPLEPPVQRSFHGHTVHGLRPVYGTFNGFLTPLCVRFDPTKDGYGVLAPCGNDGHGGFT